MQQSSRTMDIPLQLHSQSTRDDKYLYGLMMSKYNYLRDIYDRIDYEEENVIDEKLDFTEDNVFDMIRKAKNDIKIIKENNDELNKYIDEHVELEKKANDIVNTIDKLSKEYYELSTKTQKVNVTNKIDIREHIVNPDIVANMSNFIYDIGVKIENLKEVLQRNNSKIMCFNKLVSSCLAKDKCNIRKNICCVCMTKKINVCLNPCGHTFCSQCVNRMNKKCSICRMAFASTINIYIADDDDDDNSDDDDDNSENTSEQTPPSESRIVDGHTGFSRFTSYFSGFTELPHW